MAEQKTPEVKEVSVEARLKALYDLQRVVSEIDKIKTLRGELPLEVQDLETKSPVCKRVSRNITTI